MKVSKKRVRLILLALLSCTLALGGVHLVHALTLDRVVQYVETEYRSAKVGTQLDGYTVAFITDTHAAVPEETQKMVDAVNARGADLLLLGGDMGGSANLRANMRVLAGARTTDGIYGVEGNHDDYADLFAAMEENGISPLDNEGASLRDGLYLAGVQDLWNRTPDVGRAVAGAEETDFILLLSHNPDVSMHKGAGLAHLMLSGHTHGGQATVFGLWAPALSMRPSVSDYGHRFMTGWCRGEGIDVYVSNGAGPLASVPRVFARPQVIFITLRAG